jgi:hypothetical protein
VRYDSCCSWSSVRVRFVGNDMVSFVVFDIDIVMELKVILIMIMEEQECSVTDSSEVVLV